MRWFQSDILIAEAPGLLHDVGRFSQLVEFGTFSDTDSINHGESGYKIIKHFEVFSPLPQPINNANFGKELCNLFHTLIKNPGLTL